MILVDPAYVVAMVSLTKPDQHAIGILFPYILHKWNWHLVLKAFLDFDIGRWDGFHYRIQM